MDAPSFHFPSCLSIFSLSALLRTLFFSANRPLITRLLSMLNGYYSFMLQINTAISSIVSTVRSLLYSYRVAPCKLHFTFMLKLFNLLLEFRQLGAIL